MATTLVSKLKTMKYTPSGSAVSEGDIVVINSLLVGVALEDIAVGETGRVALSGIWEGPKETGESTGADQGDKLYWDATGGVFTTSSTDTVFAGYAAEAAGDDEATVRILLHPPGS